MSIHILDKGKRVDITSLIIKIGGQVIQECPLKANLHGMVVDFITYGIEADQLVKAIINLNPENFSVVNLNKILSDSRISKVCDGVEVNLGAGEYKLGSNLICCIDNVSIRADGYTVLNKNVNLKGCKDCEVSGIEFKGAYITTEKAENCKIMFNKFSGMYGVNLSNSNNNIINSNICTNCEYVGINLDSSNNNIIMNNRCCNNADGIRLDTNSIANIISSNVCSDNSTNGIAVISSSNFNIINTNQCNNNKSTGIYLNASKHNSIISNVCMSNKIFSILISDSTESIVSMNRGEVCNRGKNIKVLGNFN